MGKHLETTEDSMQENNNLVYSFKSESEVAQSCPTLCDPRDCSLSGSSIHGIFQARVLEWIAIAFSRESSRPRDGTRVSRIAGRRFTVWAKNTLPIMWRTNHKKRNRQQRDSVGNFNNSLCGE